ncbi:copper chaperone [Thelotrema lepadinum]|nr:copper chaperone [Thelotrema lepadinum]
MSCEHCIDELEAALKQVPGLSQISPSLPTQTLTTTGTAPPSAIIAAIQSTGRDAILRGAGSSSSLSTSSNGSTSTNDSAAAVAILESYSPSLGQGESPVRGLARMVQVGRGMTVVDVSLRGVARGRWGVSVRVSGDVSRGGESVGGVWEEGKDGKEGVSKEVEAEGERNGEGEGRRGWIGEVDVGEEEKGGLVVVGGWEVWEVIGRGFLVERVGELIGGGVDGVNGKEGVGRVGGEDQVVGVIARSAGVWDNEKTVCSCSGKTVWEEREEQRGRGML